METLTPDQHKKISNYLILSGILDDDLEAHLLSDMALAIALHVDHAHLSFDDAFEKVKAYPAYRDLPAMQEAQRERRRIRQLLKRDAVLGTTLLPLVSAVLFAFNRGEVFVNFWADLGEGFLWATVFCVPFAVWRVWQTHRLLRE